MGNQEQRIANWQSQAAEDESNNEYHPPLNMLTEIFADENDIEVQKAYDAAYSNHREQTK